jgi:hypothetical protein
MLRRKVIYVQVQRGHFIARLIGGGKTVRRDSPALSHPRTLAGDYLQIQEALRGIFKELWVPQMWLRRPFALIHLIPKAEGGYTSIELRAFKEAAEGAGAKMGWLCDDKYGPLSEQQVADVFKSVT